MTQCLTSDQTFDSAFTLLMEFEGYLSDDADDAGGLTKYGISQRAYPDLDIRALTLDDARRIYRRDYFDKAHCGDLPADIATVVFDAAVNMGTHRAIQFLQRAVRVNDDGVYGPQTKAATLAAIEYHGSESLVLDLLSYRALYYGDIVAARGSQRKYLRGWMRRTYRLQQFLLAHNPA